MSDNEYKLIQEKWEKFIKEEDLDVDELDLMNEELLNEVLPGAISTIINIGTKGPEVARETLEALIAQEAIPDSHLDAAKWVLRALTEMRDEKTWKLLKVVLNLVAWLGDPVGSAIWTAKFAAVRKFIFHQLGAELPKQLSVDAEEEGPDEEK